MSQAFRLSFIGDVWALASETGHGEGGGRGRDGTDEDGAGEAGMG